MLTDEARDFIVNKGTDDEYGARPLRRAVQQYIEDPLSEALLRGDFEPGTRIEVRYVDSMDELAFESSMPVTETVPS